MDNPDHEITDLEKFLSTADLPAEIQLYPGIKIIDTKQFVERHLRVLNTYGRKGLWEVFFIRLLRFAEMIS